MSWLHYMVLRFRSDRPAARKDDCGRRDCALLLIAEEPFELLTRRAPRRSRRG
jgi:hypothetical protein